MKQVTKAEFYSTIGPLNVHSCIRPGPWPYTSDWKLGAGAGRVVGRSEVRRIPGSGLVETVYFLPPNHG